MDIKLAIPQEVLFILNTLNQSGYEAFIVGGCVRDSLLGKAPKDWDITTNALPEKLKSLFEKTIDTGIKHGTVTVLINNQQFEVTTYRVDGKYSDNRRPENVYFTSSLQEDLSRRDFTVNSLAYHPSLGLMDFFQGRTHLENRLIRAVGNPGERFNEDALRMLRAIRFSAQLDFEIEPSTLKAIKENSFLIQRISAERIRDELTKILVSHCPVKFSLLKTGCLLEYILPELDACFNVTQNNPYHIYNVAIHTLNSLAYIENDRILRWTMLLHDIGKSATKTTDTKGIDHFYGHPHVSKSLAENILKRLKFDNKSIYTILKLVEFHDKSIGTSQKSVRRMLSRLGEDIFTKLLKVKEADMKAQNPAFLKERLAKLDMIKELYGEVIEKQHCISLKDLAVNGNDLIEAGFAEGKDIGIILNKLLDEVIKNPGINTKSKLLALIKNPDFFS
jgi:tRNA nucleotidyltransferase (CCA-adding enzyme)